MSASSRCCMDGIPDAKRPKSVAVCSSAHQNHDRGAPVVIPNHLQEQINWWRIFGCHCFFSTFDRSLVIGSLGSSKTAAKLSYPLVAIGQFEPGSKIQKESRGIHDVARQCGNSAQFWASRHRSEGPPPTLVVAEKSKMC